MIVIEIPDILEMPKIFSEITDLANGVREDPVALSS
jgi:hypothetical protein